MSLVIDASIGIQWVVEESGSADAVRLLDRSPIVPGLFFAECANILWKKVERKELSVGGARERAAALAMVDLDIVPDTTSSNRLWRWHASSITRLTTASISQPLACEGYPS